MYPHSLFTPAIQSHCNVLLTYDTDLSRRLLDSARRIGALNLQLARDVMAEWGHSWQRILAAKAAAALGSTVAERGRQSGTALRTYQQGQADIYASTNAQLAQTAETLLPAVSRSATALAEALIRTASEAAVRAGVRQQEILDRMGTPAYSRNGHARAGDERSAQLPH
jgi:hypothetical protein